jgi:hypothetical protein
VKQSAAEIVQCPATAGHWATLWHANPVLLHAPRFGQSPLTRHEDGTIEQVPACGGQSVLKLQVAWLTLHCLRPGQSEVVWQAPPVRLHVPGPQTGPNSQGPHSLVHRLHPGGIQSIGQVVGSGRLQTSPTGLQVCVWTLLQVCGVMLSHVGVTTPAHVCGAVGQVCAPPPAQVCGVPGPQVCGCALQVWGLMMLLQTWGCCPLLFPMALAPTPRSRLPL